jgi:hypothetical protein
MPKYDFRDDCWAKPAEDAAVEIGDVFDGVPLSRIDDNFEVLDIGGGETTVPVVFTLALVVGAYEHVVLAPITTKADVSDQDAYATLVESGRDHKKWARLPPCPDAWVDDAIVSFYMPSTLPVRLLEQLTPYRLASMTGKSQDLLCRRFARAWER